MHIHDDDDDPHHKFDPPQEWDGDDDSGDANARDRTPDDMNTIPCTRCRKLFFDDSPCCPYCGHYQLEVETSGKPLWFWITVIFCIAALGGFGALALALGQGW